MLMAGLCFVASFAGAQEITTSDGKVYSTTSLKRSGNAILIKISADAGGSIEMGLPVSRITKVAFAEPPELSQAQEATAAGNATEVLALTDSYVSSQVDFKDITGSWWPQMAKLRLMALVAVEKNAEAAALARQIGSLNTPDSNTLSRGGTLFASLESGDSGAVVLGAKGLPKASGDGAALAQVALGRAMLAKMDYVQALRAFLTVKVFYPSMMMLQPEVLFGAAQAYVGLGDTKRALLSLNEIETNFPHSIQAPKAKKMAENLSKS
jgi:hypothetical protein